MKNRVSDGDVIQWVNGTGAAKTSGTVVKVGYKLGVCVADIANGATGPVQLSGVFTGPKVSGAVFAQGEKLLWDVSANTNTGAFDDAAATPATGDVSNAAIAFVAGADGETTCTFQLANLIGTIA